MMAKVRWFFLLFIAVYALGAGISFVYSEHGWFLTEPQWIGLLAVFLVILIYNSFYFFRTKQMAGWAYGDDLQLVFDSLCVSYLILLSGGAASWVWPVYIVVIFEAAVLLEKSKHVFVHALFAIVSYGFLLAGEYYSFLPYHSMPFVDHELHHHSFFLILMWVWVTVILATSAFVGVYLMKVLRQGYFRAQSTESRLREFLEEANDLIFSVTTTGQILYANPATSHILGYTREELSTLEMKNLADKENFLKYSAEIKKASSGERSEPFEALLFSHTLEPLDVEVTMTCGRHNGDRDVVWLICRDISARKKAQDQLAYLAHHDQLTKLPNRHVFADQLRQAQAMAKRSGKKCAVLYLDLDRFKIINDSLGHAVGDRLLQDVSERLKDCVREVDTIARIGGDEFAIVLVNLKEEANAEYVAGKVFKAFVEPFVIESHKLFVTTSIGISLFPLHDDSPEGLLKKADTAMYQAKALGRNNHQVYDSSMDVYTERRIALESKMRSSIENGELRLVYQPKLNVVDGRITALEALIRWEHPELGTLLPNDFIPLAEETGLIIPMGEWVMKQAISDNLKWQQEGLPNVRVAINLSRVQLRAKGFVASVKALLEGSGLDASQLEFEISEQVIMQNPKSSLETLGRLWDIGIHISVDDFGTGYASLAHLRGFSVNTLKIHRRFVQNIVSNTTDAAIATAIIAMGKSLKLNVIAEGVETEDQFNVLKEKECDEMQGFLFSEPIPAEEVSGLLSQGLHVRNGISKTEP